MQNCSADTTIKLLVYERGFFEYFEGGVKFNIEFCR